MATKVLSIDLSKPLPSVWGLDRHEKLYALIRHRDTVLGWSMLERPEGQPAFTTDQLRERLLAAWIWPLSQAILHDRLGVAARQIDTPGISVVVCCQGQSTRLATCLASLHEADYPLYEIIVVDCAPSDHRIEDLARQYGAVYAKTSHRGIDAARNLGIELAKYDILAFTLDRACPDRRWIPQLGRMFSNPHVEAVTGLVAPSELATMAQHHAEFAFGYGYKLRSTTFNSAEMTGAELLWARHFGSGANMALRRHVADELGGFDPALSGDSLAEGAGDLDFLHRLLAGGRVLQYEPSILVWLSHEQSEAAFRRKRYESGQDFGVYLLTCARHRTVGRFDILAFFFRSWLYERIFKRLLRSHGVPRRLILAELFGTLTALSAYRNRRRRSVCDRLDAGVRPASRAKSSGTSQLDRPMDARSFPPIPSSIAEAAENHALQIRVVRTWYPHWGRHAGMNQYLKFLDRRIFHPVELLVRENDEDFPFRNPLVRNWIRHRVQRQGMPWYNLSDLAAEISSLRDYLPTSRTRLLHYLDGEHAAQFLPARRRRGAGPATLVTYHQPPDVLERVVPTDAACQFDCITVVAPEQEDYFRARVGTTPVRMILHGIDADYYRPAPSVAPSNTFNCITVGHNYRDYQAVRVVAQRLRHLRRLEFHVVSPRDTGVEDLPNVRCHRHLTDDELLGLYQHADILLLPLTKATANNSLLEGMACGLPVLSTALPSVAAYTTPECALLVERNEPGRLAEAVAYLVEHPSVRKQMGLAARQQAETLDWRHIAPQFAALYLELTAG